MPKTSHSWVRSWPRHARTTLVLLARCEYTCGPSCEPRGTTGRFTALPSAVVVCRETPMDDAPAPDTLLSQSLPSCANASHARNGRGAGADRGRGTPRHRGRPARGRKRFAPAPRCPAARGTLAALGRLAGGSPMKSAIPWACSSCTSICWRRNSGSPPRRAPPRFCKPWGEIRTALTRLDELVQDYLPRARRHH